MKNANLEELLFSKYLRNWTAITRNLTRCFEVIKSGSNCGRCIVVKIDNEHYIIHDGAHNSYMYFHVSLDELQATLDDITTY